MLLLFEVLSLPTNFHWYRSSSKDGLPLQFAEKVGFDSFDSFYILMLSILVTLGVDLPVLPKSSHLVLNLKLGMLLTGFW